MIVDLHAHYPMHLDPAFRGATLARMTNPNRNLWRDILRARIVDLASRIDNYRSWDSGPAVTVDSLGQGEVGVALSVLYSPFDEIDLERPYAAPPGPDYFATLLRQLELVERDIQELHSTRAGVARNVAELDALISAGKVALVHAVEGGFHAGGTSADIASNVAMLARRGVAYITVAHLFFRQIATNAPALPFLPDGVYRRLFPQRSEGLTALGEDLVRAMVENGILVDVTHMDEHSLADLFALLDEIDPARRLPVIASHIACRFGRLAYNLEDETLAKIAQRGGVMGVILCQHYACDGIRKRTKTFAQSMDVIRQQIDRIVRVTGSLDHVAIGTDLDGFIKPTLEGLSSAGDLSRMEQALVGTYGASDAEKICSGNALRVLRDHWQKRFP